MEIQSIAVFEKSEEKYYFAYTATIPDINLQSIKKYYDSSAIHK